MSCRRPQDFNPLPSLVVVNQIIRWYGSSSSLASTTLSSEDLRNACEHVPDDESLTDRHSCSLSYRRGVGWEYVFELWRSDNLGRGPVWPPMAALHQSFSKLTVRMGNPASWKTRTQYSNRKRLSSHVYSSSVLLCWYGDDDTCLSVIKLWGEHPRECLSRVTNGLRRRPCHRSVLRGEAD